MTTINWLTRKLVINLVDWLLQIVQIEEEEEEASSNKIWVNLRYAGGLTVTSLRNGPKWNHHFASRINKTSGTSSPPPLPTFIIQCPSCILDVMMDKSLSVSVTESPYLTFILWTRTSPRSYPCIITPTAPSAVKWTAVPGGLKVDSEL